MAAMLHFDGDAFGTDPANRRARPAAPDAATRPVLMLGNFDGFHVGHGALLDAARLAACGAPIGALSVEPHPRQFFVPHGPDFRIASQRLKLEAFARRGLSFCVSPRFDAAFAATAAEAFVRDLLVGEINIRHVVVGEGFRFGAGRRGDADLLRSMGGELGFGVSVVDTVRRQDARCSSTLVRRLIASGELEAAAALLQTAWSAEIRVADPATGRLDWAAGVLKPATGTFGVRVRRLGDRNAIADDIVEFRGDGGVFLGNCGRFAPHEELVIELTGRLGR